MCIVMYRARMRALGALGEPLERHRRGIHVYAGVSCMYREYIGDRGAAPSYGYVSGVYRVCIGMYRSSARPNGLGMQDVFGSNPDELQDTCQIHVIYT